MRILAIGVLAWQLAGCANGAALDPPSCRAAPRAQAQLSAQFLGTSTILIEDGQTAILTDGFFSRPSAFAVLAAPLTPNLSRIDRAMTQAGITGLDGLFVAHAHHDHALDAAVVAHRACAELFGSSSVLNLLGTARPRAIRLLAAGDVHRFETMTVTAFATPHSEPQRYPGSIAAPVRFPAPVSAMREGGNYSFLIEHAERRILIVTSANARPGKFAGHRADVVFLSIGGLGHQDGQATLVGAEVVIPIHWDNFTRPLEDGLRPLPRPFDNVARTRERLSALADAAGVRVFTPVPFQRIDLSAQSTLFPATRAEGPVGVRACDSLNR